VSSIGQAAVGKARQNERMAWAGILLIVCMAIPPLGFVAITQWGMLVRGVALSDDDAASHAVEVAMLMVGAFISLYFYFIPAMVAARRGHPNRTAIRVLNLLAGWTFLGWVVALVWAYSGPAKKQ
jgi:hypothetical protein